MAYALRLFPVPKLGAAASAGGGPAGERRPRPAGALRGSGALAAALRRGAVRPRRVRPGVGGFAFRGVFGFGFWLVVFLGLVFGWWFFWGLVFGWWFFWGLVLVGGFLGFGFWLVVFLGLVFGWWFFWGLVLVGGFLGFGFWLMVFWVGFWWVVFLGFVFGWFFGVDGLWVWG